MLEISGVVETLNPELLKKRRGVPQKHDEHIMTERHSLCDYRHKEILFQMISYFCCKAEKPHNLPVSRRWCDACCSLSGIPWSFLCIKCAPSK